MQFDWPSLPTRFAVVVTALMATIATSTSSAHAELPEWQQMSYRLTKGRVFAYAFALETSSGQDVGGLVLLRAGEDQGAKGSAVSLFDNLRYGNLQALEAPRLPRSPRLLPSTVVVNPFKGIKNRSTVDGELPFLLGQTVEWIFPRLPSGVGQDAAHKRYVANTPNVHSPSYFHWNATAVRETDGVVRIEDERRFKSKDGETYDVVGKGWFDFDKRDRLVSQRMYRGAHKIDGRTTTINLVVKRLSDDQLRELARQEQQPR